MGKSCQLSAADEEKLGQWIAAHETPQQVALRCRIVVAAAGLSDSRDCQATVGKPPYGESVAEALLSRGLGRFVGYCAGPGSEAHL
jgi:hypothetical protein